MTFLSRTFHSLNPAAAVEPGQRSAHLLQAAQEIAAGELNWSKPAARGTTGLARLQHLELNIDPDGAVCWVFMRPQSRPCFTPELLGDLRGLQNAIRNEYDRRQGAGEPQVKYVVLGSRVPSVYNLGGDLQLFSECIRSGDRERLQRYADLCIDVVYDAAVNLEVPVITIALVQGDALGGGFEAALACNMIIAEAGAKFGLPEVLFSMFPGMGAYNFLARRLDAAHAEQLILSGQIYSAEQMHAMGVIDLIVPDGSGEAAVRDYVRRHSRRHAAERAVYHARQLVRPVRLNDLRALANLWVDTALGLGEADLRRIERLAVAQERRSEPFRRAMVAAE